jgi:hypothetical protein
MNVVVGRVVSSASRGVLAKALMLTSANAKLELPHACGAGAGTPRLAVDAHDAGFEMCERAAPHRSRPLGPRSPLPAGAGRGGAASEPRASARAGRVSEYWQSSLQSRASSARAEARGSGWSVSTARVPASSRTSAWAAAWSARCRRGTCSRRPCRLRTRAVRAWTVPCD